MISRTGRRVLSGFVAADVLAMRSPDRETASLS